MAFNINAQIILSQPKNLNNVSKQISKQLGKVAKIDLKIGNVQQLTTLNKQLTTLNNSLTKLNSNLSSTRGSVSALGNSFRGTATGVNNVAKAQNTLNTQVTRTNQALKNQAGLVGSLGKRLGSVAKQAIAFGLISRPIYDLQRAFTGAVRDAVKFEREIVRISQVTGKSVQQLQGLTDQVNKLATSLGISANELADTARVIAQAGIRGKELESVLTALARSTLAPTFGKISDTTEGLIAAFGQFGLKGKDAEAVLGSLNKVSKEFAVEAEDLISVIRRTGGVFAQAAGDSKGTITALQELTAVFTAVRSSTRESADTIAAGLRTIFSRIQRRTTINFLKQFGVDLTDAQGKFVGIFPAFDQLSRRLDDLIKKGDALTLSAIAEELGGIRQIGKLLPAIAQFDKARKALTEAQKGAVEGLGGDVSKALDTIDNRVKRVRETFNQLIRTVFESNAFQNFSKNILQSAESFLKFGNDIVSALEPVLPILSTLGAFKLGRGLGSLLGGGIGGAVTSATGSTAGAQAAQKTAAAVTSQTQLITGTNNLLTKISGQLSGLQQANTTGFNQVAKAIATKPTGGIGGVGGRRRASGGVIPKFANGGRVYGPSHAGGGVIAELEGGEYVVPKKYVKGTPKSGVKGGKGKKNAYVFDFDDTLATTEAKGFKDFNDPSFIRGAQATRYASLAKRRASRGDDIHVLTARFGSQGIIKAIQNFMTEIGAPAKSVIAVGGAFKNEREPGKKPGTTRKIGTATKKAKILTNLAKRYNEITFLDDNLENIVKASEVKGVRPVTAEAGKLFGKGAASPLRRAAGGLIPGYAKGDIVSNKPVGILFKDSNLSESDPADKSATIKKSQLSRTAQSQLKGINTLTLSNIKVSKFSREENFEKQRDIVTKAISKAVTGLNKSIGQIRGANGSKASPIPKDKITKTADLTLGRVFEDYVTGLAGLSSPGTKNFDLLGSETTAVNRSGLAIGKVPDPTDIKLNLGKSSLESVVKKAYNEGIFANEIAAQQGAKRKASGRRRGRAAGGMIQKLATGDIVRANSVGVAILDPDDVADGKAKVSVKDIESQIGFTAGTKRGFSGVGEALKKNNFTGSYNIVKQGLNQKTSERFNKVLAEGLIKGVDFAASEISGDLGLGPTTIDQASKTKFIQSQRSALRGDLFEAALSSLNNRGKFDNAVDFARPFDFPNGLQGPFADNFSKLPNKFIDAKSSKEAAPDSNIRGKIIREIAADVVKTDPNILAQKDRQTGGKASKKSAKQPRGFGALTFASGGEVPVRISNGEMVVTDPKEVAANRGKLQSINKLATGGFASGTIARGPGTGTSDSILTTLPEGAFVVNAASTKKYLGLRRGGGVKRFRDGGTNISDLTAARRGAAADLRFAQSTGDSAAIVKAEQQIKNLDKALQKANKSLDQNAIANQKASVASTISGKADLEEAAASKRAANKSDSEVAARRDSLAGLSAAEKRTERRKLAAGRLLERGGQSPAQARRLRSIQKSGFRRTPIGSGGGSQIGQNLLGVTFALQTLTSTIFDADSAAAKLTQSFSNTILTLSLLGTIIPQGTLGKLGGAIGVGGKASFLPQQGALGATGFAGTAAGAGGVAAAGIAGGVLGKIIGDQIANFVVGEQQDVAGIRGDATLGARNKRTAIGAGGAILGGAAAGAALGSFVPVIGTAIGAAIGAGSGAIVAALTLPLDNAAAQAGFLAAKSIQKSGELLAQSLTNLEKDFTRINFNKAISDFGNQLDLTSKSFDTIKQGFTGARGLGARIITAPAKRVTQDIDKAITALGKLITPEQIERVSQQVDKGLTEFADSLDIEDLRGPDALNEALLNAANSGDKFAQSLLDAIDDILKARLTQALATENIRTLIGTSFSGAGITPGSATLDRIAAGVQSVAQVAQARSAQTGTPISEISFGQGEVRKILESQGLNAQALGVSAEQFKLILAFITEQYNELIKQQQKLLEEQQKVITDQRLLREAVSGVRKEMVSLIGVMRSATSNLNFSLDRASTTLAEFGSNVSNIFSGTGIANLGQITNAFDVNNPQGQAAQDNFFRRLSQIPGIGQGQIENFQNFQRLRSEGLEIIRDVISDSSARGSTGEELLQTLEARFAGRGLQLPPGIRDIVEQGLKREGSDVIPADLLEKLFKSGELEGAFGQIFDEAAAASDNFVEAYNRAIKITEQRTQIEAQLLQEQVKFTQAITESIIAQEKRTQQILAGNLGTGVGDGISAAERNVALRARAQAGSADSGVLLSRRQAALDRQFQLQQGVREGTVDPFSDAFVNESAQLQTEINNTTKALEGLANESEVFQAILEKAAKIGQNINALESGLDDLIGKVASGDAEGVLQIAQQQDAIAAAFSGRANLPQALTALTALTDEGNQALVDVAAGQEGAGKELRRLLLRQLGGRLAAGGGLAGQAANRYLQAIAFSEEKKDQLAKLAEARAARQRQIQEELLKQNQNQTQLLRKFLELGFAKTFEESVKQFADAVNTFVGKPSDISDTPLIAGQTFSPRQELTENEFIDRYLDFGADQNALPNLSPYQDERSAQFADEGFFGGIFSEVWGGTPEEIQKQWADTNNRLINLLESPAAADPSIDGGVTQRQIQGLIEQRDQLKPVVEQLKLDNDESNTKLQQILEKLRQTLDESNKNDSILGQFLNSLQSGSGFGGVSAPAATGGRIGSRGNITYAQAGKLIPYEPKGTDTVPAMLTPGEYVVKKSAVDQYGAGAMQAVNQGTAQIFAASGGRVGKGVLYREDGGGSDDKLFDESKLGAKPLNAFAEFVAKQAERIDQNASEVGFGGIGQKETVDFARRAGLGFTEETLEGIINETKNPLGGVRSAQGRLARSKGTSTLADEYVRRLKNQEQQNPLGPAFDKSPLFEFANNFLQNAGVLPGRKKYQALYEDTAQLGERDPTVSNPNDITTFNIDDARRYERALKDPLAVAKEIYGEEFLDAAKKRKSVSFRSRIARPGEDKLYDVKNNFGESSMVEDALNSVITQAQSIALESPLIQELTDRPVNLYDSRYDEIIAEIEKFAAGKLGLSGIDDPRIAEALQEARTNDTTFDAISKQFLETKGKLDESANQRVNDITNLTLNDLAGFPGVGDRNEFARRVDEINLLPDGPEKRRKQAKLETDIRRARNIRSRQEENRNKPSDRFTGLPASAFGSNTRTIKTADGKEIEVPVVFTGEGPGSLNLKPLTDPSSQARTFASASLEELPGSPDLQRRIDQRKANLETVLASNRNKEREQELASLGSFTAGLNRAAANAGLPVQLENPNQVFADRDAARAANEAAKKRVADLKAKGAELEARGQQLRQQQAAQTAATDTSSAVNAAAQQQETAAQRARRQRNEELEARRELNRKRREKADKEAADRRAETGGLNQRARREAFEKKRADTRAENKKKSDEARKVAAEERKARDLERANRLEDINNTSDPLERSKKRREYDQARRFRNASEGRSRRIGAAFSGTDTTRARGVEAQKSREDRVVAQFRAQYNQAVLSRNFDVARRIAQRYFSSGDISPETQSIIKGQIEAGRRTIGVAQNVALYGRGGKVKGFSNGGDVPIMAQDGEFVMSRKAVSQFGVGQLSRMNQGLPKFHNGGPVYRQFGGGVSRSSGANGPQTAVVINGSDAARELNNAIITGGETVRQSWQTLFDTVAEGLNSALTQVSTIPNQINATIAPVQIEGVGGFTEALAAQLVPKIIEQIAPLINTNNNGGSTQQGAGV